ncbi:MAG TPA: hypothetical protein EYG70_05285 [Sulfurimonas sp.]|nr:hypothetical protein [Sulfurimonas sp.]
MKKIALTLSVLLSTAILSNELSWVDQQVDAIKPARVGMKSSAVNRIKNPFIFLQKNKTTIDKTGKKVVSKGTKRVGPLVVKKEKVKTVNKVLVLSAVMNNSAMISGKWYRIGDTVNGYKLNEINRNSVLLSKHKKQLLLSTKSNSDKLKFLNK